MALYYLLFFRVLPEKLVYRITMKNKHAGVYGFFGAGLVGNFFLALNH